MRFISLAHIQQFPGLGEFPVNGKEQLQQVRKVLYEQPAFSGMDVASKEMFLALLTDPTKVLFLQWVDQHPDLLRVLEHSDFSHSFKDIFHWKQHALYTAFCQFLAPYLEDAIPFERLQTWTQLQAVISYRELFSQRRQDQLYQHVVSFSCSERERLAKVLKGCKTDQAIFDCLQTELDPNCWSVLNFLPSSYYSERVAWLEFLMQLAYHQKSSRRLMLFIHKLVENLNLDAEHAKQVAAQHRELMSGTFQFEKTRVPWKRLLTLIAVVLGFVGILVGLWFIPAEPEVDQTQEETSFMSFTPQERQQLDSLLQVAAEQERKQQQETIGEGDLPEAPAQLVYRQYWENAIFANLYRTWSQNDSVATSPFFHPGKKYVSPYPGTRPLKQRAGQKEVEFTNNTTANALILVFKDERKEPVFSQYISPKVQTTFTLNEGDMMLVLPGGKIAEDADFGELPYREVDQRFFVKLNDVYRVREMGPNKLRLIWESVSQYELFLVDLTGGLEKY